MPQNRRNFKVPQAFLGVNVQFIQDGKIVIRTLGVVELFQKHTATNIKNEVLLLLQQFNISVENILSFTTDNGSNMVKTGQLLREEAETATGLDTYPEDDDEAYPECELLTSKASLQSVRCAAHTVQLAVDDAVKLTTSLKKLIDDSRKLAKYLRTPSMARQLKRERLPLPVLDVVTRWGSVYDMMKSTRQLKKFIDDVFTDDERTVNFTEMQWDELDATLAALEPMRHLTTVLQSKNLLLGAFYAEWVKSKLRLENLVYHSNNRLATNLKKSMEDREQGQMYETGGVKITPLFEYPGFSAALFMDPRYFSFLEGIYAEDAKTYLIQLWSRMERLHCPNDDLSVDDDLPADTPEAVESCSSSDEEDQALQELLRVKNAERCHMGNSRKSQKDIRPLLDTYFKETKQAKKKTDILLYWEEHRLIHPELYELAKTVLAIPATQVSVERLFSSLRYVLNPLRYNLSAQHVDSVMLLHCNSDIVRAISAKESSAGALDGSPSQSSSTSTLCDSVAISPLNFLESSGSHTSGQPSRSDSSCTSDVSLASPNVDSASATVPTIHHLHMS